MSPCDRVLSVIHERGTATSSEISQVIGGSHRRVMRLLEQLARTGRVRFEQRGAVRIYRAGEAAHLADRAPDRADSAAGKVLSDADFDAADAAEEWANIERQVTALRAKQRALAPLIMRAINEARDA